MPIRPLRLSDQAELSRLHAAVGWAARSSAGWRWLAANPGLADSLSPLGWVLTDTQDRAVACVGNAVQRFWLNGRAFYGATGFNLIVPPDRRGGSRDLIGAFVQQPGVFAAWTFNANPRSAPLYSRHDMQPWPATHAVKLSWVVDPLSCIQGCIWRRLIRAAPRTAPWLGERLLNRRLARSPRLRLPAGIAILTDLGDRSPYADFWTALAGEGRLVADRSPPVMRWRLSDPDQPRRPLVLAMHRGGRITGMAMAALSKASAIDPPFLEVLDLVALEDEAEAAPALMQALIDNARAMGAAKVRLQVVSPRLWDQLGPLVRRARREGGWGHCHARFAADAPDPTLWSPTPYDGDYALCLRPPPAPFSPSAAPSVRRGFRPAGPRSASARPSPDRPPVRAAAC